MPKTRAPYPPEFRQRIIELVRKGRTPESLAEQFEPSAHQLGAEQLGEGVLQAGVVFGQRAQAAVREEASDDGRALEGSLGGARQSVDPGRDHAAQRTRHRDDLLARCPRGDSTKAAFTYISRCQRP